MIQFSAPGKIHLLGEHCVVYGKPALISAIDLKVLVTVGTNSDENYPLLRQTINNLFLKNFKVKKIPDYEIASTMPAGSGLGFSAAGSAAIIGALFTHFKIDWDLKLINRLTFEAEKVFHGTPSGGDNTSVVFGGLILFQTGMIIPATSKINDFILINSGKPEESTKEMIAIAKSKIASILADHEALTSHLLAAMRDGDEKKLIEIFKKGQANLEKIGVVGKKAQKIINDLESLEAGAKISGAGGVKSGSGMILIYHKNPKKILQYAKDNKLEVFQIKLSEEGLKQE